MVYSKFEIVTPEKAYRWLEGNTHNRPTKPDSIRVYAEAMKRGEWMKTHQGIAFSDEGVDINGKPIAKGTLLDGQNRLWAVIESNVDVEMMVTWGLDPRAFRVIDTGVKRSAADTLYVDGERYHKRLADALGWLYRYARGAMFFDPAIGKKFYPSNTQIEELLAEHPNIRNSTRAPNMLHPMKLMPAGIATWLHYEFSKADPEKADNFFKAVGNGENIKHGDPEYALRDVLLKNAMNTSGKLKTEVVAAYVIKAWNAYFAGKQMARVTFNRETEDYPVIIYRIAPATKAKKGTATT